ncbi:putative metaloprotease [Tatumella ptyseos ATCC 33301]|uniref:D-alanyl-D-alanine dipeptidase n=2 Tax=Tatumella ptyseos TaxID=82987 RepID=A0A085JPV4_9GAMM|nr:D-alanyl-D-alanine dipeptidase [Tatumella ptyseos]KFD22500.1 putative metaloprotease [Tatumella ptyseos ATCC 33301]SQK72236.1 D-alanyl-D-alanine dipeptidase [Tatumella ptyseos]
MDENNYLIDIRSKFPNLIIDMKYASSDNITQQPIYSTSKCLLHFDAAHALEKSINIATLAGFHLLVLDAYRPTAAQELLWNACPNNDYVVPLSQGSNHSRGTAIDVTLVDAASGMILDMGTEFDEMNPLSHPHHPSINQTSQRNRLLLNAIMFGGGFTGIVTEWWHFELPTAADYPLIDDVFTCFPPAKTDGVFQ